MTWGQFHFVNPNRPIPLRMHIWIPGKLLGQKTFANQPIT